jgi:hypothetical protein
MTRTNNTAAYKLDRQEREEVDIQELPIKLASRDQLFWVARACFGDRKCEVGELGLSL